MEQLDRDGLLLRDLTRSTMREIVAHVVRHEAVYGSLNRISSVFALRIVLAEHIEQSVRIILREGFVVPPDTGPERSEEHTSELQSLMRISYAVFCLKKKTKQHPG